MRTQVWADFISVICAGVYCRAHFVTVHFGPFTLSFECETLSVPAGRLQAKTSPPDLHTILPRLTFNLITDCNPLYGLSAVLKLCLHPSMKTFLSGLCSPWMRLRAFYYVSILRSLFEMEILVWVYYWLFHYLPSLNKKRVIPPEKLSYTVGG